MTLRLVADIGGTNTRIALSEGGTLQDGSLRSFSNDAAPGFDALLRAYLSETAAPPAEVVVAVAGPVRGDRARLTNRDWHLDAPALARIAGAERAVLLNDLAALGHAVPRLGAHHLRLVRDGSGTPDGQRQSLVVGLGTGFNVSPVIETRGAVICPVAEAGHVSLPGQVGAALADLGLDPAGFPTIETLFSGRGLARFCALRLGRDTVDGRTIIAALARDPDALTALRDYGALLGWLLRDLTLSYMALSGLYIAGGVGRAVALHAAQPCAEVLHRPCTIRQGVTPPLWSIEQDSAALWGCAHYG